jgi:cytochrome P450
VIDQALDFFTAETVIEDPFSYYDHARSHGPVWQEPHHGCFVVTGYPEAMEVYRDTEMYSSCNAFGGPFPPLPDGPHGDDVSEAIERNRHAFVSSDSLIAFDPPKHHDHRTLMMRLLTPKRLQENEAYMWRLADEQIDTFASSGRCEFLGDYAQPVAMLVIADLLGVPVEDRPELRRRVVAKGVAGAPGQKMEGNFLAHLEDVFTAYIEDRRRSPRDDVMTKMAQGSFPDGRAPELMDVVRTATFLFAGGQGTAARFLGNAVRYLAEHHDVQDLLRRDPDHIPAFVEETLRYASPVKTNFRMARRTTTLGGVEVPAGSTMMILMPAADRDERRFPEPDRFDLTRSNGREHVAFGRGIHSCPGAPLVRFEGRITVERMLARLRDIRLSEEHHGPPGDRRFEISPSYILAGVEELHLEFETA